MIWLLSRADCMFLYFGFCLNLFAKITVILLYKSDGMVMVGY